MDCPTFLHALYKVSYVQQNTCFGKSIDSVLVDSLILYFICWVEAFLPHELHATAQVERMSYSAQ